MRSPTFKSDTRESPRPNPRPETECDVLVVGGGPAGATIARLLVSRGHTVSVAARRIEERRGLAESLPPSARKILSAIGIVDAIDAIASAGNIGNVVWWGQNDARVEDFDSGPDMAGQHVWRPRFDRILAEGAVNAGVRWCHGNVHRVRTFVDRTEAAVGRPDGSTQTITARFVVDASGRSAVLGRHSRRLVTSHRTHAWIGRWRHAPTTGDARGARTYVETTDDGWLWSVPISATERCVTVMVDPDRSSYVQRGHLESRYRAELAKGRHIPALVEHATLADVWGCDASVYDTAALTGRGSIVIGDAASFIDPLSSVGVKKALTSAWMGAAVVHTCLTDPAMTSAACDLFASCERQAYTSSLQRSVDHAKIAAACHGTEFWRSRAELPPGIPIEADDDVEYGPEVAQTFDRLRERSDVLLRPTGLVRFEWQAAFRGHRVAFERAVSADTFRRPVRFIQSVNLASLVDIAAHQRRVGDLFEAYCRHEAPVPLPNFLTALSVLVARRVLEAQTT